MSESNKNLANVLNIVGKALQNISQEPNTNLIKIVNEVKKVAAEQSELKGSGNDDTSNIDESKNEITLFIKTMEGWSYSKKFKNTDSIINIKAYIEESIGIMIQDQRLVYEEYILDDSLPIYSCGIIDKCVVVVMKVLMNETLTFIKLDSEKFPLIIMNSDSILDVKIKIKEYTGLPLDQQILMINEITLENEWTMEECKIVDNCVINVIDKNETVTNLPENLSLETVTDLPENLSLETETDLPEHLSLETVTDLPENLSLETVTDLPESYESLESVSTINNCQGVCNIINIKDFTNGTTRNGALVDESNIRKTFEILDFTVKVYSNIKSSDLKEVIKQIKKDVKIKHRMLIVFVLSHGNLKGIAMSDGVILSFDEIWNPFTNNNFQKFAGNSKIFFFVCCRGSEDNKGVEVVVDSDIEFDDFNSNGKMFPSMSDFFFGYATCLKYKSCRSKSMGTSYVKCLCEIIQQNLDWSISQIHEQVQNILSREMIKNTIFFQMPYYENILRSTEYFVRNKK